MKKIFFIAVCIFSQTARATVTLPSDTGLPSGTLYSAIENLTKWILGIFGFIAIIGFVVSGIFYLTASGDDKQQEKAKKQMTWSIIGVIIGLSGYIVVKAVDAWLGGSSSIF